MGYRKYRSIKEYNDVPPAGWKDGELATVAELSRLSGCSSNTIRRFAQNGTLPTAGVDEYGSPLFNLEDAQIADWIAALQRAGYAKTPLGA